MNDENGIRSFEIYSRTAINVNQYLNGMSLFSFQVAVDSWEALILSFDLFPIFSIVLTFQNFDS